MLLAATMDSSQALLGKGLMTLKAKGFSSSFYGVWVLFATEG